MKLQILFVFVFSVHLVLGKDTRSPTPQEVNENPSEFGGCGYSKFTVTSSERSFGDARAECLALGGDLLQNNFGPEGSQYHDEIYQLAIQYTAGVEVGLWIGYTDVSHEGSWRFLNGDVYDANYLGQYAVAYWGYGEPNSFKGENQDCGKLWRAYGPLELDDEGCSHSYRGLCEIKSNCL